MTTTTTLAGEDRARLLDVADQAVAGTLATGAPALPDTESEREVLRRLGASFVTLRRGDALLGCIGSIEPRHPLVLDVARNAVSAAFHDPRLPVLTVADYEHLEIKVSVLGPRTRVEAGDLAELAEMTRPGVDGLLVSAGRARGTFLPAVWEQLPDVGDFLAQLWHKAGLPPGSWPADLVVERYESVEFGSLPPRVLQ